MSLPVPLTVRVGDTHVTREVSAVGFRKEAIGGVRNVRLRLARPLDAADTDLAAYSRVYLYDARTAETIAEARISDLGRSAGTSGQQWDVVAFGPAQHASDKTLPLIYVDRRTDTWTRGFNSTRNATTDTAELDEDTTTMEICAEEGKTVGTTWLGDMTYRGIRDAGMKLSRVTVQMDAAGGFADYRQRIVTRVGDGAATVAKDIASSTSASTQSAVVVTDFTNGDDVVCMRAARINTATTGTELHQFWFYNPIIRARLKTAAGADITTGYTNNYVLASEVVNDLLGRVLDQYDGANATVATTSTAIGHLAYPDGVTAARVFDDLMIVEPAYRWTTGPDTTGNGYSFSWEEWPTTVRYETTLEDGGSFPVSAQELYNSVMVRWTTARGRVRSTTVTAACEILDDAGVTRQAILDAGDETISSVADATALGTNFLAEHNVPANAGTLTVSRPIRDLSTGAMVQPFEIEPGELVRVRGVESSPDSLNASSNDGQTVFRIWSMEYDSDSNTAVLELDTYSRTTANAIARLIKRRTRRR